MDQSRREFIKQLGVAAGGIVFSQMVYGCGSGNNGDTLGAVPNGYQFYNVLDVADTPFMAAHDGRVSGAEHLHRIVGDPQMSDTGRIVYLADDADDVRGLYEFFMDWSTTPPTPGPSRRLLHVGQEMDGQGIRFFGPVSLGHDGTLVQAVGFSDDTFGRRSVIDVERGLGFENLLQAGDANDDGHVFGGIVQSVSTNGGHVVVVGNYRHRHPNGTVSQFAGLFNMPADGSRSFQVLMRQEQAPIQADFILSNFGLVHNDGQEYVVQVSFDHRGPSGSLEPHRALMRGFLDGGGEAVPVVGTSFGLDTKIGGTSSQLKETVGNLASNREDIPAGQPMVADVVLHEPARGRAA